MRLPRARHIRCIDKCQIEDGSFGNADRMPKRIELGNRNKLTTLPVFACEQYACERAASHVSVAVWGALLSAGDQGCHWLCQCLRGIRVAVEPKNTGRASATRVDTSKGKFTYDEADE
jgi:hypothetical protein